MRVGRDGKLSIRSLLVAAAAIEFATSCSFLPLSELEYRVIQMNGARTFYDGFEGDDGEPLIFAGSEWTLSDAQVDQTGGPNGGSGIQFGISNGNCYAEFQGTFTEYCTATFEHKISSRYVALYLDGVDVGPYSIGSLIDGWDTLSFTIAPGFHTLRFVMFGDTLGHIRLWSHASPMDEDFEGESLASDAYRMLANSGSKTTSAFAYTGSRSLALPCSGGNEHPYQFFMLLTIDRPMTMSFFIKRSGTQGQSAVFCGADMHRGLLCGFSVSREWESYSFELEAGYHSIFLWNDTPNYLEAQEIYIDDIHFE
jgi:hypothetical protein